MNQSFSVELMQVMHEAASTGLFTSLASFLQPDGVQGPTGNPSGDYVAVDGLSNIPCVDAPPSVGRVQANDLKSISEIMAKGLRHVLLNGYYPAVIDGWRNGWQAVIDGTAYEILGAEPDSQKTQVRLDLQLVTL